MRVNDCNLRSKRIAEQLLRGTGIALIALGIVHLIATPHIPSLLDGSPRRVYAQAVGPTLLNHVLAGILLLPLGFTTWLAADPKESSRRWARRVLTLNASVVLTLPVLVLVFMRRPQYYTAPLFLAGVGLVVIIGSIMIAASILLIKLVPSSRLDL